MRRRIPLVWKLLAWFLALSLPPLVWFGLDASRRVAQVGRQAVERSTEALDERSRQTLELQAKVLADRIAAFLEERIQDARVLAAAPKDPRTFGALARGRTGILWRRRRGPGGRVVEVRGRVPLYAEVAWVGPDGRERFRWDHGRPVPPSRLRDVSRPEGTTFGVEPYFTACQELPPGEPWVGHVVGRHVGRADQLAGARTVEEAVGGAEYRGILRFALAVRRPDGTLEGVVALALDHRHLMEFTQHVLPLSRDEVVFPSYLSGNYAFLFDDEGWIIAHPKFWDIRGLGPDGRWVPPYTEDSTPDEIEAGRIPFNLDFAGFVHPNYPLVAREVRAGRAGVTRTYNVAGVDKVMAYAPVRFGYGPYRRYGVFGGVTIGARTEAFHRAAAATAAAIASASRHTLRTGFVLAWCLGILVVAASAVLSRAISHPVRIMAHMARRIAGGDLTARVRVTTHDELADLADDLNRMARLLGEKDQTLRRSLEDLRRSRDEARTSADRLAEQLRILNHIQSISEFLGTTFDREAALKVILDTCVRGLGFDRAVLHLVHGPLKDTLQAVALAGFDPTEELRIRQRPFVIGVHDCVATRVVRTGRARFVRDLDDPDLTALDRRIAHGAGTTSFVYVPMKIRDRVVGVLAADNARSGRAIPEHLLGPLQIVAGQAARAVERARLFEEAEQARRFVERVLDSLASGVVTLDGDGRVLSVNTYAAQAFGCDPEAVRGRPFETLGAGLEVEAWARALAQGAALEPREFTLGRGEARREFVWVPSRFGQEGGQRGLILQFRDVTEERMVRRTLERMDRLASLGRLAAGVAHEVRNPLTGVALLLDDLHDRLPDPADREALRQALGEIERLEGIVQELLEYARVDTAPKRECRIGEIVEGSLFLVEKTARRQGIRVVRREEVGDARVLAAPEKLKQAVLNLLLNAVQAMPDGGELRVTVAAEGDRVAVEVADTGVGIPPGDQERIFEPFFSLRPGGSGLGLSITHTIVEDHGGTVEVSSSPGEGSVFRLLLPRAGCGTRPGPEHG
ncbi:MAG: PAS domain-containing protein [Deltaproteobacteria bacterium]|nr:PAS domain-containing protein [Deltaproteobacteria bacterium]